MGFNSGFKGFKPSFIHISDNTESLLLELRTLLDAEFQSPNTAPL
jgi:hypothetical protein